MTSREALHGSSFPSIGMNGDFLALLPRQPELPASIQPETGKLQGTTVFAFQCADGVLMAGDHRATAGNLIFSDRTEKIIEIDEHTMMAIAGSPATAFEMARTLQTSFEFYRRSQLRAMSLPAKLRALSRLLRDNLAATLQGVGVVAPLIAGVDPLDEKAEPGIYFYDPLGAQFEGTRHAASGSGSGSIKSVLHYLEQWGNPRPAQMPLEEAVRLAIRLLMTAAEFDSATGGVQPDRNHFATLKLLNRSGTRDLSATVQRECWEQA